VKTLAKFLLSSIFVFLPATCVVPLYAQHYQGTIPDSYHELHDYDSIGLKSDEQKAIENLEKRCQQLEHAFQDMQWTIQDQPALVLDNSNKIKSLESSLDLMQAKLRAAEDEIHELKEELEFDSRIPPHPANRKAAVNKSSDFIPETPATTPHPASKKPDACKPKAPASKPTSGFVPDFPPMSSASKPKAPDNNPTPAAREGTH
jgi:hypothetical protein